LRIGQRRHHRLALGDGIAAKVGRRAMSHAFASFELATWDRGRGCLTKLSIILYNGPTEMQ
jgi:hypothetical protein